MSSAPGSLGMGACVEDLDSLSGRYYGYGPVADGPAVKAILICTFVKTKYSTPSQVVPLVMPFPKLSLEPM